MREIRGVSGDFFRPHVGSLIGLADGEGNVVQTVEVRSVTDLPRATAPDASRTAFSVTLAAPEPCACVGGDFILVHPDFGTFGPVQVVRNFPGTLAKAEAVFSISFN